MFQKFQFQISVRTLFIEEKIFYTLIPYSKLKNGTHF